MTGKVMRSVRKIKTFGYGSKLNAQNCDVVTNILKISKEHFMIN
jgi:hypothetical protein